MIPRRVLTPRITAAVFALLFLVTLSCTDGVAIADDEKAPAKPPQADVGTTAEQIKELQKQVAELQTRLGELQKPRIIAAGTATFNLGAEQDNATRVRVRLNDDVAARLGEDYVVLLTTRFPTGGYPFFVPYWKRARDGFDVTLVDVSLGNGSTASYDNRNKAYPIDWIVVKK